MSSFIQFEELSSLICDTLKPFEAAALMTSEGQVIGMKYQTLADVGTFGPLSQIIAKYFKMQPGDVVITNDPYSGGTNLTTLNLVTPLQIADQSLYLAVRIRFVMRLTHATRLEDEGIRIPPTPVVAGRKMNEAILSAISSHPQAPQDFSNRIQQCLNQMWRQIDLFQIWSQKNPTHFSKNLIKSYFQATRDRIKKKLSEYSLGDHRVDVRFETGEIIRLRTEIKENEVNFDFAGTSNSQRLFLTNLVTHGVCASAFFAFLEEDFVLNEGALSFLNVTTPQGCFLNAQYPAPVFEGTAEASPVLASAVIQSLTAICSAKPIGLSEAAPTVITYEFESGKIFFDGLPGGTGATPEQNGMDAYFLWILNRTEHSIEEIERNFPVLFRQSGIRHGSGGKGKQTGGNGTTREVEVLEKCTLKWILGHRNAQVKSLKGATSGQPAELFILKTNGEKIMLTLNNGEIALEKGDRVVAASAGGGGFGKADPPSSKNPST